MIKKFIGIKNVGRFAECGTHGDVELRRQTYLFAENARGKSTLCAILRSLQSGDAAIIEGRKRLGQTAAPEVTIRLETRNATYRNGSWDAPHADLMVFDNAFVHENVFAGDLVDHGHKRNLHRLIIGRRGVALAQTVERLDGLIRDANRDLGTRRNAVEALCPRGMQLAVFIGLPPIADIAQHITTQEQVVAAATQASTRAAEIRAQAALRAIDIPSFPIAEEDFLRLLTTQIADVAHGVESTVREHLAHHTRNGREAWLVEGRRIHQGDDCPYCGQNTKGVALVETYGILFGEAYADLQRRTTTAQAEVNRSLGAGALLAPLELVAQNGRLNEFWRPLVGHDVRDGALIPDVRAVIEEWRTAADELLTAKLATPFERVALSSRYTAARDRCGELRPRIDAYNSAVTNANRAIAEFKARTPAADLAAARGALDNLRNVERRFDAATISAVDAFRLADATKTRLDGEKAEAKAALDTYSMEVFAQYQNRINELLRNFNAGFRIGNTEGSYVGGRPSSSYKVIINDVPVALGDGETPVNTPSFRNTLSGGDRSALAFAFFVAQAERDPSLANLTLVFDDPYNSQDRSRQICTQQILGRLANQAKQVIVMSHNPHFLRLLWQHSDVATTKMLQFGRIGPQTYLAEWDVEAETRGEYEKDYWTLRAFASDGTGDVRLVARTIRVLLETYLRLRFVGQFVATEWLGDFIEKIRLAPAGSPLAAAQPVLPEIESLNDYSKRYHHGTNNAADTEPIDATELSGFANRTLTLIGGF